MKKIKESFEFLKTKIGDFVPQYGIVLGTGLGKLADEIEIAFEFPYNQIPNFVEATVEFHKSRLIFGKISGKNVVCMQGRFHYYEGYSMAQITFPIRVMKLLGIDCLLISNAAGGLNPAFQESDLMIINDHISQFLPSNPLLGANILGDRFPDMSEPYSLKLIEKAKKIALKYGITTLKEGVYVSVTGPQLETKAEYRMMRMIGADAVGMSTVPEVMVARQMNIPVFGVSVITDMCIPETLQVAEISKIIENAAKAEPLLTLIFKELIAEGV
jgi:purine-nucleoside phosphorylase